MYQILETRGYILVCRGSINVKGKGSMVTYFLKGKSPSTNNLQIKTNPQSNLATLAFEKSLLNQNSEDLSTDFDINSNTSNLTAQRRKSLCRQHNISSSFGTTFSACISPSLSNSSSIHTSSCQTVPSIKAAISTENDNESNIQQTQSECSTLKRSSNMKISTTITTTAVSKIHSINITSYPKSQLYDIKQNLACERQGLKDSIENLEILLKNDISLSDLSNKQQYNIRSNDGRFPELKLSDKHINCNHLQILPSSDIHNINSSDIDKAQKSSISQDHLNDFDNHKNNKDNHNYLMFGDQENRKSPIRNSQSMCPIQTTSKSMKFCNIPNSKSMNDFIHQNNTILQNVKNTIK